jgi:hypothetical protein
MLIMKPKFQRQLRRLILFPFLVLGFTWMYSFSFDSGLFWFGLFMLMLGIFLSSRVGRKGTNLSILISFTVLAYLLGEGITYSLDPYVSSSGFNNKCTQFDPIRGYRWLGDTIRSFKTRKGEIVYDNHFYPNNRGWIMDLDYTYKKKDSTKKRWMILGDSFVAGIMLETNLPNRAQQLLKDSLGRNELEIYSFGVDGGGIMNWYNIFFKEIIPNYEFDGVIIAPYADNLYRDFMVMLIQENGFMGRIDSVDWSANDSIKMSDFKSFKAYDQVYSDLEIERFLNQPLKRFDWPFKIQLKRLIKKLNRTAKIKSSNSIQSIEQLNRKMGVKKFTQLDSMISWCKSNQKQLILASIPSRNELNNELLGEKNQHKVEMKIIAKEYQLNYFDGYTVFKQFNAKEVDAHWLKYDGHWNQKGSNKYAKEFAEYLIHLN